MQYIPGKTKFRITKLTQRTPKGFVPGDYELQHITYGRADDQPHRYLFMHQQTAKRLVVEFATTQIADITITAISG